MCHVVIVVVAVAVAAVAAVHFVVVRAIDLLLVFN